MHDTDVTVQGSVVEIRVNDDITSSVHNATAVCESRADTDTPSVNRVTVEAVSSRENSSVVYDDTTTTLKP